MKVYRISRTKWAKDLSGEGARLYGGRWNRKGVPCVYTATSRSLAVLEYSVNVALDDIPRWLSMVTLEVPDHYQDQKMAQLPGNWSESPAPSSTRELGTKWLNDCKHLLLRVPSSVIPQEFNILINPLHPELKEVKILSVEDFVYDVRIKAAN